MRLVDAYQNRTLYLGYQGENERTTVVFPTECLTDNPGTGTFTLFAKRNGDSSAYPIPVALDDNKIKWLVRDVDVAKIGHGEAQLIFQDGATSKTKIWDTVVFESLTVEGGSGDPEEDWVARVLEAADRAEQSAADIEDLTVSAVTLPSGFEATVTKTKPQGEPYNLEFGIPKGEKGNVMFAVFTLDPITGILTMATDEEYSGANFQINQNGYLEVII